MEQKISDLAKIEIEAIAASDKNAGQYALYGDGRLFMADISTQSFRELAGLQNIQKIARGLGDGRSEDKELEISIAFHHPYICVTERFGVNGALYSLDTGNVLELQRKDYHCDVSSYSIGFLELDGRVLLICQTEWNRLDIIDAATGENLTQREVSCRNTGRKNEHGNPVYEYKNYLDYFHSKLHVSPDGKHFLSNGWLWGPQDHIYLFDTDRFFEEFESCNILTSSWSGYNWDRPCTFIDDDLFVIVLDDALNAGNLEKEEEADYTYKQLAFYRLSDIEHRRSSHGCNWIDPFEKVVCTAFKPDEEYGEVDGLLYYDREGHYLVAINRDGAFAVSLTGEILACMPEITFDARVSFSGYEKSARWDYSPEHLVFYAWQGDGIVERRFD